MSDISGPTGEQPTDPPLPPPTDPTFPSDDPTMVMPVTPGPAAAGTPAPGTPAPETATFAPMQTDQYTVVDRPWYRQPGPMAGIAIGVLILLGIGGFLLLAGSDDDTDIVSTTDVEDSVQLEITRMTRTEEAVAATLTAIVTGPVDRPAEYQWILPPGATAPQPAVGATDDSGSVKFAWTPIDQPTDDSTWSSTVTIDEVLAPNSTLEALSFECVLDRNDETSNITIFATIAPGPVTDPRDVRYEFADGVEFVSGDAVTCPILAGDPNVEPTLPSTTLPPETSTTAVPESTTIPTSTLAPTTLPPTTLAPAPTPTTAATTTTTTSTTTTIVEKTTVISVISGRQDLSTFSNLIDRAGLRDQLAAQNAMFTVVAPNNDAIAALLATPNPPDLNDPAEAREFVLAHVKTGEVLSRSDLAAMPTITFDVGPERTIDASVTPITIGGAGVIEADAEADLGVVHTLGRTLVTPAP